MKRKLFIGSSSGQGLEIAKTVEARVTEVCGKWIDCVVWNRGAVFDINRSFLDSLLRASQKYHYGIFVATKDDPTVKKGASVVEPRDNVIFEMGLFLGSMGVSRSFLLVEEGVGLPSDFEGIAVPHFSIKDEQSALSAVDQILERIGRTQKTFNLKPIPSATLALGYFHNFLKPFATRYREKNKTRANLKILLPQRLISLTDKKDFNTLIDAYGSENKSEDVSIYEPGTRPVIKRILDSSVFWDIPTTIFTLKELFDKIPSDTNVVGVDESHEQWLSSEVSEFGQAIIGLMNEAIDFKLGIFTEVAWVEIQDYKILETPWPREK
jgi:hypothetical protein